MLVYIAGPYGGKSRFGLIRFFQVLLNIWRARRVAVQLWAKGFVAICPHLNTFLMDNVCQRERFLEGDLEILKHCDALVTAGEWFDSEGTRGEIDFAGEHNIPVFHGVGAYLDWDGALRRLAGRCDNTQPGKCTFDE